MTKRIAAHLGREGRRHGEIKRAADSGRMTGTSRVETEGRN